MSKQKINLYDAIREMRRISDEGGTFSLTHRKYDRSRNIGGDLAVITHARLRPQAQDEKISHASRKLFYTDTDTGEARNCWECLVIEFNGMRITL